MTNQTQLELIRNLAQSREQELAAEVGEMRRLQLDAQSALNRLHGYLSDYTVSGTNDFTGFGAKLPRWKMKGAL